MSIWVLTVNHKDSGRDSWAIFGSRKEMFEYVRYFYPDHKQRKREWVQDATAAQMRTDFYWYEKQDYWSSLS
tara:strand:- start:283 stop:498 length:216 start_codon:yes stop_codon:yes gene_type:complete